MHITFIPEDRRQKYLLGVLGLVLLGGAGVVWYRFFWEPALPPVQNQPPLPRQVDVDFTIFEHPIFLELGEARPPIVAPDQFGKRNPFAPIP